MSVVINTNSAATGAANNLAASNAQLQRSLNRLSSGSKIVNPADDAGGLAVSMKLSATARRQGAVAANVANATSYLQTQDGALNVAAKLLTRISELKTLDADITKSTSDHANYNVEFTQLQAQLTALSHETFNGVSLFGSSTLDVGVTAEATSTTTVGIGGASLMGSSAPTTFSDNFANLTQWPVTMGSPSVAGNVLTLDNSEAVGTSQTFSGPLQVTFTVQLSGAGSQIQLGFIGGGVASDLSYGGLINDTSTHSVRVVFDGAGNASTYLDGSASAVQTMGSLTDGNGLVLQNTSGGSGQVSSFAVSAGSGTPSNTSSVSTASNLGAMSLSTITSALQDVATLRANNGSQQSRLGFAAELLTVNKANLEAATSRITDVDVAAESTSLARFNVLVQAGTAMLSQANQSAQMALKLLS